MNDVNWLMVVTAAILIVAGMLGYINGLIKTILNLVLGVVTLILVIAFSPRVCEFLQQETPLPGHIQAKVEEIVWEQIELRQQDGITLEQLGLESFVEELPFLPALKDAVMDNAQFQMQAAQETERIVSCIGEVVSEKVVIMIGYVATFVVVFVALRILAFLLDIIGHLPLIHGINKLTGLAAGLVEGLIVVWLFGIVLTVIGTTELGQSAARCIQESRFLSVIYGYNLLQEILFWMIA